MKAPQVNTFYVCQLKGNVLLEVEFDLEGQRVTMLQPLSSKEAANNYLSALKRKWMLEAFENWVNHKRHIIDAYPNEEKKATINNVLKKWQEMTAGAWATARIAETLLKGKAKLEFLLPSTENKSYESSKRNLQEILLFCSNEVNQS